MANSCPNKKDSAYILLEKTLGEKGVMAIFMANNEELPTLEVAQTIVDLHNKTKNTKSEVDKITEEIKDTDKDVIVANVEEYFDVISKHLRNLRERKSYERLKNIFTTTEGINKLSTLQDILSQAEKVQDSIEGDARKIRAIAQSIVQINHLTDLMLPDVKELIKNTDDSIENLHVLQTYLNTLGDWNILLDEANKSFAVGNPQTTKKIGEVKLKIAQIENYIAKNDESGVVKTLQKILIPASQDIIKSINIQLFERKTKLQRQKDRNADSSTIKTTEKEIKALEDKIKDIDFENKQNVIDFLKGKRGDATVFNTWLESFRDSSDPTISAFATFVKEQIDEVSNKVYKIDLQYQKELAPLVKESERLNPESLTEKITFKDKIIQNGELTEVLTLLNPWKDYRADYSELLNKEKELKDKWRESNIDEDKQEYLNAKKVRQNFEKDIMHQEFLPEVYKKYKLFEDEIGQELKEQSDEIWQKINEIDESYRLFGTELTEEQEDEKEVYLLQYKMLGNLNQPDGTPKTGKELDKAKRMQEIRALNRQFYEWKDNTTMFEKAKERHSEYILSKGIASDSKEYKKQMLNWEENNTRVIIKDEFYKERDNIVKEIAILTKKFKNKDLEENISDLWKTIQSITYGLRDEDNQPIGILIQEKGAERIKIAQKAIIDLQSKITKISGLSNEEQNRLSDLYSKAKLKTLSEKDKLELEDLIEKSKAEGLNKREKERLFKLFAELKDLQTNIPTEYYVQAFNNLSTKDGIILTETGDVVEESGKVVSILESKESLNKLLKNKDFKEWFDLNHIQIERFNPETKVLEKKWQRTYQWNRIIPNNPDYQEIKPSLKYSYRQIKPEYKTERIVGKTVDNKGNWLPDSNKPLSVKYNNTKYFNLVNSKDAESKRLSKILDIHKEHLLSTQDNLARNHKLYLDVPRVDREGYEKNISFLKEAKESPGDIPKIVWNRIKESYRNITSYDTEDSRYESPFDGKYDKDFIKVPMKYTGKIDIEKVSLDLFRSISKYTYSSELNKKLVDSLSVARALARVVEGVDINKPIKKQSNIRKNAIRKIIIKEFEGQKSNLDLAKLGEWEKPVFATINAAKYLAVWSTIKINIPAAIANVVNAVNQNWINAGNNLYSKKTFATSLGTLVTRFYPEWQKDYYENKLGNLSLESQMFDVFEPIQGITLQDTIGEKSSQSKLYDTIAANWLFNMREWGEKYVQSRTWIAAISETMVDYNQGSILLIDAYELDENGVIKLKEGIDKAWEVGGDKFNRLKYKIQALNRKVHGNYASYDKTQIEMYALGSLAMFLKRFFVSMAANRFAFGESIHQGRFNISSGLQYGYYTQTLSIATKQIKNGLKDWDLLTLEEKQALSKTAMEIGVILGSLALMALMGYSGDDRNKKEKLIDYSWLELNLLYQLDRLYIETSSFISPKSYLDYTIDFQIKTALEKWLKLITDFISQNEYESSLKSSSGNYVYQKGDKKWKTQLKRATGIQQMLLFKENPDVMLKNYDRSIRGK
jgi:hypothetical protein